tara:strand:+ start:166 stop:588 length:423 start_codon:yes stop_codon:yes gene_type:complete
MSILDGVIGPEYAGFRIKHSDEGYVAYKFTQYVVGTEDVRDDTKEELQDKMTEIVEYAIGVARYEFNAGSINFEDDDAGIVWRVRPEFTQYEADADIGQVQGARVYARFVTIAPSEKVRVYEALESGDYEVLKSDNWCKK